MPAMILLSVSGIAMALVSNILTTTMCRVDIYDHCVSQKAPLHSQQMLFELALSDDANGFKISFRTLPSAVGAKFFSAEVISDLTSSQLKGFFKLATYALAAATRSCLFLAAKCTTAPVYSFKRSSVWCTS